jgi:hypothetical protein
MVTRMGQPKAKISSLKSIKIGIFIADYKISAIITLF